MTEKTYRIGDVAALLDLKSYVLRFWETEFSQLEPLRTNKGQRLYTEEHVSLLRRIKHLLHEQGMTIDGARRALREDQGHKVHIKTVVKPTKNVNIEEIRNELLILRKMLAERCDLLSD